MGGKDNSGDNGHGRRMPRAGFPRMFSSIRVVDQMSSVTVRHDRKERRNDGSMVHRVGMKYSVLRVEVGKVFVDKMTCTVGYGLR